MGNLLSTFAQYNYDYDSYVNSATDYTVGEGLAAGVVISFVALALAVTVLEIIGTWKTFTKAKQPGWAALVPIYNMYIMLKLVGRPWWWLLLFLIPLVNIYFIAVWCNDIAKSFGKGVGFAVLMFFLSFIAFPILGFGPAKYLGPSVKPA